MIDKENIINAFSYVVETLSFMFADVLDKNEFNEVVEDFIEAKIEFSGFKSGNINIIVPVQMCLEISSNSMGEEIDEALKHLKATDAVKELLNITCGKILTETYGEEPIFDLTPPEVIFPDVEYFLSVKNEENSVLLSVDDYPVLIKAEIK